MGTATKSKIPVINRQVATVSLKRYKKLLINAGFNDHQHLTKRNIELNESGAVANVSLGDAYRALEEQKSTNNFSLFHESSDTLRAGVRKLTEFLYAYKNFNRNES